MLARGARRLAVSLLVIGVLAAACADPTDPQSESIDEPATIGEVAPDVSPDWERFESTFALPELDEQTLLDIEETGWNPVEIELVEYVAGAYYAIGEVNGRATVWRSDDLPTFAVVFSNAREDVGCCRRHMRLEHILDAGDRVIVAGNGTLDGVDRVFVLASSDGVEWIELDDAIFSAPRSWLSQLVFVGEHVIANVAEIADNRVGPGVAYRSDDLGT